MLTFHSTVPLGLALVADRCGLIYSALGVKEVRQRFQFQDARHVSSLSSAARHAVDNTGTRILSECQSTGVFHCANGFDAVVPHPRHQQSDGLIAKFLRDGAE